MGRRALALSAAAFALAAPAFAQRADENIVRAADDAFGASIGNEKIGLYNQADVRGFSPIQAGNVRLEGLYFDMRSNVPSRLVSTQTIRVGLTAQGYAFPAPTGIVDYALRPIRDRDAFSTFVDIGPNDAYSIELDAEKTLIPHRLGVSMGAFYRVEEFIPEDSVYPWGAGIVSRWRPRDGSELMAFYGYGERLDDKPYPFVITNGPFLPPHIRAIGFAQDWSGADGAIESYGFVGRHRFGEHWTLNAGLYRHNNDTEGPISDLYLQTDANGLANVHRFVNEPPNEQRALSGEARLTGVFSSDHFRHSYMASFRGRDARRNFGGASVRNLGPAQIGQRIYLSQPVWAYGGSSFDEVRQTAIGLGYQLAWRGVGEVSLGLQRVDYEKTVTPPFATAEITTDTPIFPTISLALTPTQRLAFYASFTRGLEESPIAPDVAANAYETPPAIRTEQREIGLRYAITPRLRFVMGYFEVQKPYFNLDPSNVFRQLGDELHRGVELSLSGRIGERLNIVGGAVLMDPTVEGEAVASGQIGPRPVSQAKATARLNLDYRTRWIDGLSIDAALAYSGPRAATSRMFAALGGEQLETEALTTLDLGLRYRFSAFGHASTLRAQVTNVTDEFAWQVMPSGALYVNNPRGFHISLATDF